MKIKLLNNINEKNLFKLDVNLLFAEFYEYLEIIKNYFINKEENNANY